MIAAKSDRRTEAYLFDTNRQAKDFVLALKKEDYISYVEEDVHDGKKYLAVGLTGRISNFVQSGDGSNSMQLRISKISAFKPSLK